MQVSPTEYRRLGNVCRLHSLHHLLPGSSGECVSLSAVLGPVGCVSLSTVSYWVQWGVCPCTVGLMSRRPEHCCCLTLYCLLF